VRPDLLALLSCCGTWGTVCQTPPVSARRTARREGQLRAGERGTPQAEMPGVSHPLIYPENLTAGSLAYFLAAPTLVS
jgi:hypothetical protein